MATYPFRLGPPAPPGERLTATPFGGLAIVHNLSGIGDALVTVALAGSVFVSVSLHAAHGRTALGLVCTVLPFVVVGPFVGPLIDRVRGGRRFIVFLAAIGRLAACLMMAAWIHKLLLFPAAFLSLVCSKTHAVAKASLVPAVVDSDQDLVRANAKLAVGSSIFTAVAAGVGCLVYRGSAPKLLLDLDVLVFALTAALGPATAEPAAAGVAGRTGRAGRAARSGGSRRRGRRPRVPPPSRGGAGPDRHDRDAGHGRVHDRPGGVRLLAGGGAPLSGMGWWRGQRGRQPRRGAAGAAPAGPRPGEALVAGPPS